MDDYISNHAHPFIVHLLGDDKLSCMFQAGALSALRDLDLLQHTHIWSASGTANWTLAFLAKALYEGVPRRSDFAVFQEEYNTPMNHEFLCASQRTGLHESYQHLDNPTATGSGVAWWQCFVDPLFRFLRNNQELEAAKRFMQRGCWTISNSWRELVHESLAIELGESTLQNWPAVVDSHYDLENAIEQPCAPTLLFNAVSYTPKSRSILAFTNHEALASPFKTLARFHKDVSFQSRSQYPVAEIANHSGFPWTPLLEDLQRTKIWEPLYLPIERGLANPVKEQVTTILGDDPCASASLNAAYATHVHKLQPRVLPQGFSRCAYVVNAFTTVGQHDSAVSRLLQAQLKTLRGAETVDQSVVLADRSRIVDALAPFGLGAAAPHDEAFQSWLTLLRDNKTRMEKEEDATLFYAFNWGHIVTWHTYRSAFQPYPCLPADIPDIFHFQEVFEREDDVYNITPGPREARHMYTLPKRRVLPDSLLEPIELSVHAPQLHRQTSYSAYGREDDDEFDEKH